MNSSAASGAQHELRVLLGMQAGARLSLSDGRYIVGAAETADVIVAGPGVAAEHAALTVAGARVRVQPLGGSLRDAQGNAITAETELAPGFALEVGSTWVAVDRPSAPWPQPLEWLDQLVGARRQSASATPAPAAAQTPASTPADEPAPEVRAADSAAAPQPAVRRRSSLAITLLLVGVTLVIGAAVLVALLGSPEPVVAPQAGVKPSDDPNKAAEAALLEAAIARIGPGVAAAVQRMGPAWIVSGNVATDKERAALAESLGASGVRAALRVVTNEEVMAAAAPVLTRAGMPVQGEMTGVGVLRLVGAAGTSDDVQRVTRTLREDVPGVRSVDSQILLPDQLYERLRESVRQAGLGEVVKVAREPAGRREIVFSGTPTQKELERWEQVVREFVKRYGLVLPIKASFKPRTPTPPFTIRTVAGGATPHIVTGAGVKVFEGGSVGGYTLVAIRDDEIVLQGQEELRIPRERIADGRVEPVSR